MTIGRVENPSEESLSGKDEEFSGRTFGGTVALFFILFLSTCISGCAVWAFAEYLIQQFR
jgi:hypothetical protein